MRKSVHKLPLEYLLRSSQKSKILKISTWHQGWWDLAGRKTMMNRPQKIIIRSMKLHNYKKSSIQRNNPSSFPNQSIKTKDLNYKCFSLLKRYKTRNRRRYLFQRDSTWEIRQIKRTTHILLQCKKITLVFLLRMLTYKAFNLQSNSLKKNTSQS